MQSPALGISRWIHRALSGASTLAAIGYASAAHASEADLVLPDLSTFQVFGTDGRELIYETCKTYLFTAGQVHHAPVGLHRRDHAVLLRRAVAHDGGPRAHHRAWSLVGIAGSYGVAWFGIRVNTFANSRTAFASLQAASPSPPTPSR
jgi:hypothetical protein